MLCISRAALLCHMVVSPLVNQVVTARGPGRFGRLHDLRLQEVRDLRRGNLGQVGSKSTRVPVIFLLSHTAGGDVYIPDKDCTRESTPHLTHSLLGSSTGQGISGS